MNTARTRLRTTGVRWKAAAAPSEAGLYRSALAAYEKALQLARAEDIVPFGRSLGSAPAVHMAANAPTPCAALLLQSPLMSGAQAILGPTVATARAREAPPESRAGHRHHSSVAPRCLGAATC